MSQKDLFETTLRHADLHKTEARTAIFNVIRKAGKPVSIQEIIKQANSVHKTSVYRGVEALLAAKILTHVPMGFKNYYELSEQFKPHHHHATCENCGTQTRIRSKKIEKTLTKISKELELTPTTHHVEIFGICQKCSA